ADMNERHGQIVSVNVGLPRDIEWRGRTVHTAIWKDPVRGRCRVGRLNLDGGLSLGDRAIARRAARARVGDAPPGARALGLGAGLGVQPLPLVDLGDA